MNALVPVPDGNSVRLMSLAELQAHYKAVHRRLNSLLPEAKRDAGRVKLATDLAQALRQKTECQARLVRKDPVKAMLVRASEKHAIDAQNRRISFLDIQRAVAEEWDLSVAELVSAKRTVFYCTARFSAIWLCRQMKPYASLPEIARRFGHRDHTTALNAIRKTQAKVDADPAYAERLAGLRAKIEGLVS